MRTLEDYREIVGDDVLSRLYKRVRRLYGARVLHINSTFFGGGVAEMLTSLVPLMNSVGLDADWRILHGTPDFFNVTKKFHNALQGGAINLTEMKKRLYVQTNEEFASYCKIDHDVVVVHDPQPLPMVRFYKKAQPWVWRCHVDLSDPNSDLWSYLKGFILRYDVMVVSSETYLKEDLPVEQRVFFPAIDPLSTKNEPLSEKTIHKYMKKFNIPLDKPIIAQISRFDKWKDPEGVLEIFRRVREEVDCRLVLCGNMAEDDPEGWSVLERVRRRAGELAANSDVILVVNPAQNNIFVNSLQRTATVIIQKSIREGFGLTVTEAMWKGTPVVASRVGGIPLQIEDGESGYLVDPHDNDAFVEKIVRLLKDPEEREHISRNAVERVRQRFLITRLLGDHLDLYLYLLES